MSKESYWHEASWHREVEENMVQIEKDEDMDLNSNSYQLSRDYEKWTKYYRHSSFGWK